MFLFCPRIKMAGRTGARSMIAFLLILLKSVNSDQSRDVEAKCSTPLGQVGICTKLSECQSVRTYLQSLHGPWPANLRSFLISSHCGFDHNNPKLCCPAIFEPFDKLDPVSQGDIDDRSEQEQEATGQAEDDDSEERRPPLPTPVDRHPNLRLLTDQPCGDVTGDRLLGGNKTGLTEYPWMALIAYTTAKGLRFQCAGTVISRRYILTAAHCLTNLGRDDLAGVRVGEHDLRTDPDCEGPPGRRECSPSIQDFTIEETIPHSEYVGSVRNQLPRFHNDIGLIRINGAINFTYDNALPICLPTSRQLQRLDLDNSELIVTGWGATEESTQSPQLLQITIPIVPNDVCAKIHNKSTADGVGFRQLCAGGIKGVDSCHGDSGGPIQLPGLVRGAESFVQHGVVSYGPRACGMLGVPAVYTRVAHYMDWILDHMKP